MITKIYQIPNISCNHCIHTIQLELSEIAGVKEVNGDLPSKQIKVVFEEPETETEIVERLKEINYPPEI